MKKQKETPEQKVYSVKDIQAILGIGKNQAYQLLDKGLFNVVSVGKRRMVSKDSFNNWLNGNVQVKP